MCQPRWKYNTNPVVQGIAMISEFSVLSLFLSGRITCACVGVGQKIVWVMIGHQTVYNILQRKDD